MSLLKFSNNYPLLVDRLLGNEYFDWSNRNYSTTNTTLPAINIKEDNEGFLVEMAAPGLSKEDFKIDLDHDLLTISSEKKFDNETKAGEHYTKREFSYQSFSRSFTLPNSTDRDKIKAKYENGILKVYIPKKEEAKPQPPKLISIS